MQLFFYTLENYVRENTPPPRQNKKNEIYGKRDLEEAISLITEEDYTAAIITDVWPDCETNWTARTRDQIELSVIR